MSLFASHAGVVFDEPNVLRYHTTVAWSLVLEQVTCSRCKHIGQGFNDSQNVAVLPFHNDRLVLGRCMSQWHLCITASIGQHCSMGVRAIAGLARLGRLSP